MTDSRQHRVDALRQAARRKSEAKTKAAEAAIRALVKRGEPITFQSVQREAGVSHASSTETPTSAGGSNGSAPSPARNRPRLKEPAATTRSSRR